MKSIEVTYDVSVRGSEVWEPGEAAFQLDFVDDDIAALLQKLVGTPISRMSDYEYYIWRKLDRVLDNLETLRKRVYLNNSIKSIKVIGGDT
jgi:hypothetical protein